MKRTFRWLRYVLAVWTLAGWSWTCSTFVFTVQGNVYYGKNYDWSVDDGVLTVNKRGVPKTALTLQNPVKWTSRFGSATFNQYGREFPNGGMNEAGLVIEVMWLRETRFPAPDERPAISAAQWVQFVLDTCASVPEVLATDEKVRIEAGAVSPPLHFLVADAAGRCAAVEWVAGQRVVHTGETLPVRALANSTYDESLSLARDAAPNGDWQASAAALAKAPRRFDCLAGNLERLKPGTGPQATAEAFELLEKVRQGNFTKWAIVYDVQARTICFKTLRSPAEKTLVFAGLDFSCAQPVLTFDLNAAGAAGDITSKLTPYDAQANRATVERNFAATGLLKNIPGFLVSLVGSYPATLVCPESPAVR